MLLSFNDSLYPEILTEIAAPPTLLYVTGSITGLHEQNIAIVGSRNPSQYGKNIAYDLGIHLSTLGLVVCSGLAIGIDSCAHQGTVDAIGRTIAVLGCGLNHIYPKRNKNLAAQIVDTGGALVTEFPPNEAPTRNNFPRRNRIISGLSIATVVVEATVKSGSLITANLAAEQGRNVFAFPGSIYSTASQGCHKLIRAGATLVRNNNDIIEELNLAAQSIQFDPTIAKQSSTCLTRKAETPANFLDNDCQRVWNALECGPFGVDSIVQMSGIGIKKTMICLHKLVLAGNVVESLGLYQRK